MLKNRLTEGGICTVEPVYYLHGILSWSLYQPAAGSRLLLYNTRNIRNFTLYIDEGLVERGVGRGKYEREVRDEGGGP